MLRTLNGMTATFLWCYAAADGTGRRVASAWTPMAQMNPKSSRPTAVTTSCLHLPFAVSQPYPVAADSVFCLGDHSSNSRDCRFAELGGAISLERLIGPVIFRVWPLSRIGPVR